jgi:hypothetical protein
MPCVEKEPAESAVRVEVAARMKVPRLEAEVAKGTMETSMAQPECIIASPYGLDTVGFQGSPSIFHFSVATFKVY